MTRSIARVRFPDGTEGDVLHVSIGGDTMTAYFALVRISTGELRTRRLDGAVEIERPEPEPLPVGSVPGAVNAFCRRKNRR